MRILVVDDEPLARARLKQLVEELAVGEVVGEAADGTQALHLVQTVEPDLLLLDIRMPGMDGIEVARHLARLDAPPAVVFTTAYDSHALAAIEASAVDYLLKPIRRERLSRALDRARSLTRAQLAGLHEAQPPERQARTHIAATLQGNLQLLPVAEVRFFRAEHKYVTARHSEGELIIEDSLSALENEFATDFMRVHRNALVSRTHVRGISRSPDGRQLVDFDGVDDQIEVSRRLISDVRRALRR